MSLKTYFAKNEERARIITIFAMSLILFNFMSKLISLSPNLYISDTPLFGNYSKEIVYHLLRSVDINFSTVLNITPFSTCSCIIDYDSNNPKCCSFDGGHLIFLHITEDYWSQWIYQFAHEYCHHLINTKKSGKLKWFEETICELSSMYHLYMASNQWSCHNQIQFLLFAQNHQNYLNDLLSKNPQLISDTFRQGFLHSWLPILEQQTYHRDYYNALAAKMYPLFVENPYLWKIILHLDDIHQWNSLPDLFSHLNQTADNSYSDSLKQLENLLFS